MRAEDWEALFIDVTEAFSPGFPIKERDLLAGRLEQIERLIDVVHQKGRHAVVFGERGVGKTSLVQTFALGMNLPARSIIAEKVNAGAEDTFASLWRKIFRRLSYQVEQDGVVSKRWIDQDYPGDITTDDVQIELSNFSANTVPILIVDEFDKADDPELPRMMSQLIKDLSDFSVNCTIIIVGVADDVSELISNHKSISRQLIQIEMPRMSRQDLEILIRDRFIKLGISIDQDTLWRAAVLSRGLPYFAHLLGMHSGRRAVLRKSLRVSEADLEQGIKDALEEVDQKLKETYSIAISSKTPKTALYEPVLLACALADCDDLGRFQQKNVEEPLAFITASRDGNAKRYKATTYAFHMNEMCEARRGEVLRRSGEPQNPRYRFDDPMMQPYIILRGLADGRIDKTISERFSPQRQPYLSSDFLPRS